MIHSLCYYAIMLYAIMLRDKRLTMYAIMLCSLCYYAIMLYFLCYYAERWALNSLCYYAIMLLWFMLYAIMLENERLTLHAILLLCSYALCYYALCHYAFYAIILRDERVSLFLWLFFSAFGKAVSDWAPKIRIKNTGRWVLDCFSSIVFWLLAKQIRTGQEI